MNRALEDLQLNLPPAVAGRPQVSLNAGLTAGSPAGAASELGEGNADRAVKTPPGSLLLLRVSHFFLKKHLLGYCKTLINFQSSEKMYFDHFASFLIAYF